MDLTWIKTHFCLYNKAYELYSKYYDGEQYSALNINELRKTCGTLADVLAQFRENLCAGVINTTADRLLIDQITGSNQTLIDEIWDYNKMQVRSGEIHQTALTNGDAYCIVWLDESGKSKIYTQKTCNIAVRYNDDGDKVIEAAKSWITDKYTRLTIYYPDRIERYISKSEMTSTMSENPSDYRPYDDDGNDAVIPNPYGIVPVFRFANGSEFAKSDIKDVIPLQNSLNWVEQYMLAGVSNNIFPLTWMTSAFGLTDENGREKNIKLHPGTILAIPNDNAKVGREAGADLSQFTSICNDLRNSIARVSQTPIHTLTGGNFPSGDSLFVAEAPLRAKVRDRQLSYGETWEQIIIFASLLQRQKLTNVDCVWDNSSTPVTTTITTTPTSTSTTN